MENGPGPDLLCVLCCSRCGPCVPCTGPSRDPDQDQLCVLCCSQCGPCVPCVGFSWDLDPTLNDYHWHTTVHWHSTRNSHSTCLSLHSVNDKKTKELTDLCTIILWQATRTTLSMQHGIILELTPTDSDILYTHPTGSVLPTDTWTTHLILSTQIYWTLTYSHCVLISPYAHLKQTLTTSQ